MTPARALRTKGLGPVAGRSGTTVELLLGLPITSSGANRRARPSTTRATASRVSADGRPKRPASSRVRFATCERYKENRTDEKCRACAAGVVPAHKVVCRVCGLTGHVWCNREQVAALRGAS